MWGLHGCLRLQERASLSATLLVPVCAQWQGCVCALELRCNTADRKTAVRVWKLGQRSTAQHTVWHSPHGARVTDSAGDVECRCLQVLYSYIFGIFFFKEHLTLTGGLGSLLVALGEWPGTPAGTP